MRAMLIEAHAARRRRCIRRPPASRPAPAPRFMRSGPQRIEFAHGVVQRSPPRRRRCRRAADAHRASRETRRRPAAGSAASADRSSGCASRSCAPSKPDSCTTRHSRRSAARARCTMALRDDSPRAPAPHNRAASSARARRLQRDQLRGARAFVSGARAGFEAFEHEISVVGACRRCRHPCSADPEEAFGVSTALRYWPAASRMTAAVQPLVAAAAACRRERSAVTAQTSASSRSGERPADKPSRRRSRTSRLPAPETRRHASPGPARRACATGSARSHLPRVARTAVTGTVGVGLVRSRLAPCRRPG